MTQYRRCNARPPFSVGLSRVQVCKRLGVPLPETTPKVEKPKDEPKEEVAEVVEDTTTKVQEEPVVVEPAVVEEPVETPVEEQVKEPVEEIPVEENPSVETPVENLNISKKQVEMLKFNGISTIEELSYLVESGEDIADLPKIGQAAKKSILEGLEAWQNAQNQTK